MIAKVIKWGDGKDGFTIRMSKNDLKKHLCGLIDDMCKFQGVLCKVANISGNDIPKDWGRRTMDMSRLIDIELKESGVKKIKSVLSHFGINLENA